MSPIILLLTCYTTIAHSQPHPSTFTFTTTTSSSPLIHVPTPHCWNNPSRFRPLIFRDCLAIITSITADPIHSPDTPLKFSTDATHSPDIQLPKYWKLDGNSCRIGLDLAPRQRGYDRTTLRDIEDAATAIAIDCVIKAPHQGGYWQLGWRDRLGVLMSGRAVGGGFEWMGNGTEVWGEE